MGNVLRAELHPWILEQAADETYEPGRVTETRKHKMLPGLKTGRKEGPGDYPLCLLWQAVSHSNSLGSWRLSSEMHS